MLQELLAKYGDPPVHIQTCDGLLVNHSASYAKTFDNFIITQPLAGGINKISSAWRNISRRSYQ